MKSRTKSADGEVRLVDMYGLKIGALWRALRNENVSLWMLCTYIMFEYVRPQDLYPVVAILPWGQTFLLLAIITAIMDPATKWVGSAQNRILIVFTIIVVTSSVFAFRPAASMNYWEVYGGWFLLYFVMVTVVNTERRLLLFLLAYCLFNLKMGQHGTISWASRGFSFAGYGLVGSPGWFRDSGEFAIQMLIYGSLAIAMVVAMKEHMGKYTRWFAIVAAATGYFSVMGASSRGAQIGLAAIAVWLLLKQKNGLKGLLSIVVLATALYYLMPEQQMERFREMGEDRNSLQRLVYWQYAIDNVIPKFPVLGLGYNNWLSYMWFIEPDGVGPMRTNQAIHNIYLQAVTEVGLLGFATFLLLVICAFYNNIRTRRMALEIDNKFMYFVSFGLDAGLIGFLVAGSFVTVLFYPFFWVQIAMITALYNVTRKLYIEKTSDGKRRRNPLPARGPRTDGTARRKPQPES